MVAMVADVWVVEGQVSGNPHAHPIQPEKGQRIVYIDTVAEGQIVAYVTVEVPPEGSWVRFSGTALRFETTSPRPGSTKKFPVKQLTVEKTESLAGCDAVQDIVDALARGGPPESKANARVAVEKAGKDAFPVLIAALDDAEWKRWWLAHCGDPFEAIRERLKPLVDEFFKSRANTQQVP